MRYLDPKNDLTFKKIFGEHPDLLMSLLNALMPLDEGQEIVEIEYLPAELVPEIPEFKNSIVDVRCIDNRNRQFIVEMQMLWTSSFKARVLFNASKAYVRQIKSAKKYSSLEPVYALSIVDDTFISSNENPDFYHHYSIVNCQKPEYRLDGLEFVFVELPKFTPKSVMEKRMAVLWLRFLTEIQDREDADYNELKNSDDNISKALDILQESSFTKDQLEYYDKYWDNVRYEKTYADEKAEIAATIAHAKGKEEGKAELTISVIVNCHKAGMTPEQIAPIANIPVDAVITILKQKGLL